MPTNPPADLICELQGIKKQRQAVVLAHSYQPPEIQDVADYVGDSLGLSISASQSAVPIIVFCGVHFMAQTAKILSPAKTVLLPVLDAGCPMADMINAEQMRDLKARHPQAQSICYINTSAEVKAECDLCCTSANAVALTEKFVNADAMALFVPDKNLAAFVARQTGRAIIAGEGFCPIHEEIKPSYIKAAKHAHPQAVVLAHPECPPDTFNAADMVVSTEGMLCYAAQQARGKEFIIATEAGMLHRLRKACPDKVFYPAKADAICADMKRITLPMLLAVLVETKHVLEVEESCGHITCWR